MTRGLARLAVVALVLVPASAAADAGTARPPVALTASPSHVDLSGAASAFVRVTNSGSSRVVVDVTRAGFALDLRGRPRVVGGTDGPRSAARWLTFRPRNVALRPGASAEVAIASTVPPRAEPGDHDALVLFTTRRRAGDGVAVRMRMGVVVVVRAPGTVVRRLALGRLRVVGSRRTRALELLVANGGNVTETIQRSEATVSLFAGGRRIARLKAIPRDLRPGTRGILQFRYPGRTHRPVIAQVAIALDSGRILHNAYRVRV